MPQLNFMDKFATMVAFGQKANTIRARQFKVGQRLYLYTGARTKHCYKLGEAIVTASRAFSIGEAGYSMEQADGTVYEYPPSMDLAHRDGFSGWIDMVAFFKEHYGIPQTRQLYFTQWSMIHKAQWERGKSPWYVEAFPHRNPALLPSPIKVANPAIT